MLTQHPQPSRLKLAATAVASFGIFLASPPWVAPSAGAAGQQEATENESANDSQSASAPDEHAEAESAELGVVVGDCPGDAVCVLDSVWGSPADEAGIRQGDYIVSINGKKVTSPRELQEVVGAMQAGEKATVRVWRRGEERDREITLAAKAEQPPESHRAWLGVMLVPAEEDEGGVEVDRVIRGSPASKGGLQSGDVIVRHGDTEVSDAASFIESVEELGPGSELALTVRRDGTEHELSVTLGHMDEAPMEFLQQAMRLPMDEFQTGFGPPPPLDSRGPMGPPRPSVSSDVIEETLDEMRQRLRALEREVRELKGDTAEQEESDPENDLSNAPPSVGAGEATLVVQRDGRGRGRGRGRGPDFDRRWDRGFDDWRRSYRRGFRPPVPRSPRDGYRYYRYRGNPYYYGGYDRRYGPPRSGFRIGNLRFYWY